MKMQITFGKLCRVCLRALLICGASLNFQYLFAQTQDSPWYFEDPSKEQAAPAAINTVKLSRSNSTKTVIVAVLDSGIDSTHPSLTGKLLPGVDMVSPKANHKGKRSSDFEPDTASDICPTTGQTNEGNLYHGTEVASVIAGNGNFGVIGVLSAAKILPVKIVGACSGRRNDLIDGITWASGFQVEGLPLNPTPAKVINISMAGGSATCTPALQDVINRANAKNIIIVSAAGNTFGKPSLEPAVCNGVISVGALNPDKSTAFFSAVDSRINVGAPGGGAEKKEFKFKNKIRIATIESDFLGVSKHPTGSDTGLGTSFSAPLASGVIAALALDNPDITAVQVMDRIQNLAKQSDDGGMHLLNYESMRK